MASALLEAVDDASAGGRDMSGVRPWGVLFFDIEHTLVSAGRWRPGARRCLARLGDAGLRLGIIANTGAAGRAELASGLPHDFRFVPFEERLVVLSAEVGVSKPDARIFAVALSRAQVAAEQTLFIGEDPHELLAAQRIGMRALRLVRAPRDFDVLAETAIVGTTDGRFVR